MTSADCFYWHDVNEDEPPPGVEIIGMWIDSDGTTSTLPVVWYHPPDYRSEGDPVGWTYDDTPVREPHAWCANLDAHQPHRRLNPPNTGDTPPVKPAKTPAWALTVGTAIMAIISALGGFTWGYIVGTANAWGNTWGTALAGAALVVLISMAWFTRRVRKEVDRG